MLQIIIVVFREILEISLIIGILTAVTKNIPHRAKWIASGLALGLTTSLALAFFTDKISESFEGLGQEIFNGAILMTAATMISWTVIWMQKHAKSLSGEFKQLSHSIQEGKRSLYSLLFVVFFSVLREGAEIVLFSYSSYISGTELNTIILALMIGLTLGILIGVALYYGLLKIFGRYFFMVTSYILVFLAAGITAQAFGFWMNADIVPALQNPIWDSSYILSQNSIFGKFLHIFLGYIDRPAGIQILAYLTSLIILITGLQLAKSKAKTHIVAKK